MKICYSFAWLLSQLVLSDAFLLIQPSHTSRIPHRGKKPSLQQQQQQQHTKQLHLSSSNDSPFDISKPVFDLYSFRSIRGDALAKYNSLNQSEPLRINLAALAMLTCLASPWLVPELSTSSSGVDSSGLTLPQGIAAASLAVLSGSAFIHECQRRSKQLTRLEKELEALDLLVKLPSNLLADAPFSTAATVRELLKTLSIRLVVVRGTAQELTSTLQELRVLGRRLTQANAYVVVVPTDGSTKADWGLSATTRYSWLAEPESIAAWNQYFDDTLLASTTTTASDDNIITQIGTTTTTTTTTTYFRWFGLKPTGRTFGSGSTPPSWLQVMGRNILPIAVLDENDPAVIPESSESVEKAILGCQQRFYTALTTGNEQLLKNVYCDQATEAVDRVIRDGGRMDMWETCLADGARPEGMKVADADVTIVSDTLAYSTTIEFPAMIPGATLLAVQMWTRANSNEEWKLREHQTIPWSSDSPAGGTLICDCRGCVSLVRSSERRTFGGLIG